MEVSLPLRAMGSKYFTFETINNNYSRRASDDGGIMRSKETPNNSSKYGYRATESSLFLCSPLNSYSRTAFDVELEARILEYQTPRISEDDYFSADSILTKLSTDCDAFTDRPSVDQLSNKQKSDRVFYDNDDDDTDDVYNFTSTVKTSFGDYDFASNLPYQPDFTENTASTCHTEDTGHATDLSSSDLCPGSSKTEDELQSSFSSQAAVIVAENASNCAYSYGEFYSQYDLQCFVPFFEAQYLSYVRRLLIAKQNKEDLFPLLSWKETVDTLLLLDWYKSCSHLNYELLDASESDMNILILCSHFSVVDNCMLFASDYDNFQSHFKLTLDSVYTSSNVVSVFPFCSYYFNFMNLDFRYEIEKMVDPTPSFIPVSKSKYHVGRSSHEVMRSSLLNHSLNTKSTVVGCHTVFRDLKRRYGDMIMPLWISQPSILGRLFSLDLTDCESVLFVIVKLAYMSDKLFGQNQDKLKCSDTSSVAPIVKYTRDSLCDETVSERPFFPSLTFRHGFRNLFRLRHSRSKPIVSAHNVFIKSHSSVELHSAVNCDNALRSGILKLFSGGCTIPRADKSGDGGEDSFFFNNTVSIVGVADGVGAWASYGSSAGPLAMELMTCCAKSAHELYEGYIPFTGKPIPSDFETNSQFASKVEKMEPTQIPLHVLSEGFKNTSVFGSTTAIVAALHPRLPRLSFAIFGDSKSVVIRFDSDPELNDVVSLRKSKTLSNRKLKMKHIRKFVMKRIFSADFKDTYGSRLTRSNVNSGLNFLRDGSLHSDRSDTDVGCSCQSSYACENIQACIDALPNPCFLRPLTFLDADLENQKSRIVYASKSWEFGFNVPFQLYRLPDVGDRALLREQEKHRILENLTDCVSRYPHLVKRADEAHVDEVEVQDGDLVILGSDGLFDNLFEETIQLITSVAISPCAAQKLYGDPKKSTDPKLIAQMLTVTAYQASIDVNSPSPFAAAYNASKKCNSIVTGGKPDDITAVCCWVTNTDAHFKLCL